MNKRFLRLFYVAFAALFVLSSVACNNLMGMNTRNQGQTVPQSVNPNNTINAPSNAPDGTVSYDGKYPDGNTIPGGQTTKGVAPVAYNRGFNLNRFFGRVGNATADKINSACRGIAGVNSCNTAISGDKALVAIRPVTNTNAVNLIPTCEKAARAAAPTIKNVAVTTNQDLVSRIYNMCPRMINGNIPPELSGEFDRILTMVKR